jgi:hypothetical protein
MKLSTGIERPKRPKPLVVSKTQDALEPVQEQLLEPLATPQEEPTLEPKEESTPVTHSTLDPITAEAVERLPEAPPQEPVSEPEAAETREDEPLKGESPKEARAFAPKPFHIALGVGAIGLLTALVFRGGGGTSGSGNLDTGTRGGFVPTPSPDIPTFNGRPLNIK